MKNRNLSHVHVQFQVRILICVIYGLFHYSLLIIFSFFLSVLYKYHLFSFSVRSTWLQSCDSLMSLCWVTSVPRQNFSLPRRRSSISFFDRDSVFVKTSKITDHKYLKRTIGFTHFSMKCFTNLQE